MDYTKEFIEGFACDPPEYLPDALNTRLEFFSCLSHKEHREVFLTKDSTTGKKAILKISDPDSADSVKREYELLSKLDHPAIPKTCFYHEDDAGREYLIRDYLPGDTLDYLLARDGTFDIRTTLELVKKLCGIMSYLHRQNPPIIYRDIKPQNIIVTPNGKICLIDFGISREFDRDKSFDTIYVGSAAFAAPELYGFTKSDSRTDVFALGRLLLYLRTGSTNQQEAMILVESKPLVRIIKKCTELSPEKRYASVEKLSKAIGRVLHPPTRMEFAVCIGTTALCLAVGLLAWTEVHRSNLEPQVTQLVGAGGSGYEQEVKIAVSIQTLFDGQTFADCAVAVDNHQWYAPAKDGRAELYVYAFDEYKVRAVSGNRTAFALTAVSKDTEPLSFTFDLSKTPEAPEYHSLSLPFGQAQEFPLNVSGAETVTFAEQPAGISVEKRGDGFYLVVSGNVEASGHYYLFAEAVNAEGKADMVISLYLDEEKPITVITTAGEFDRIRENLSGRYALGADIDLSAVESWTPIGTNESPFIGEFDGKGFSITGLHIQGKQSMSFADGGLFGVVSRGVIRNIIVRDANLYTAHVATIGYGFIVGKNNYGLIENCAVFNSKISADVGLESGVGGICGINFGIVKRCFNTAEITILTMGNKEWTESCAGGICGTNSGYIADCGNTGGVTGICLAGGVVGFNDMGILTRCYSAGYVKAPAYFTTYFSGGVAHLLGRGKTISYCAFEKGTAQVGANVFNGGTLLGIAPLDRVAFRDLDVLNGIFHGTLGQKDFAYASLDSYYPMPTGIYSEQTAPPILAQTGFSVTISPVLGVKYFFTLDGTDPHLFELEGVDSISLTLKDGETLKVFAARSGYMDSETIEYKPVP